MVASGLAIFLPAISGAEPCTGSKIEGAVRSGLMLPEAAMPMVPAVAGPRADKMSPDRFEATITSKRAGVRNLLVVRPGTGYLSVGPAGEVFALARKGAAP